MRSILVVLALTSMVGAANAAPSLVQQAPLQVQQADWYCGPHCQRQRYWEHRRWERERWRESQAWRYHHPYNNYRHPYNSYYGYNYR